MDDCDWKLASGLVEREFIEHADHIIRGSITSFTPGYLFNIDRRFILPSGINPFRFGRIVAVAAFLPKEHILSWIDLPSRPHPQQCDHFDGQVRFLDPVNLYESRGQFRGVPWWEEDTLAYRMSGLSYTFIPECRGWSSTEQCSVLHQARVLGRFHAYECIANPLAQLLWLIKKYSRYGEYELREWPIKRDWLQYLVRVSAPAYRHWNYHPDMAKRMEASIDTLWDMCTPEKHAHTYPAEEILFAEVHHPAFSEFGDAPLRARGVPWHGHLRADLFRARRSAVHTNAALFDIYFRNGYVLSIGELIHKFVCAYQTKYQQKITGMIIEQEPKQLIHLLANPEELKVQTDQALNLLEMEMK